MGHATPNWQLHLEDRHLEFGACLAFVLTLVGFGVLYFHYGGVDFRIYYAASTLVLSGGNPYDWAQMAPVLVGVSGYQGNGAFFYPPWFAVLVVPFALLPFQAARAAWLSTNLGLLYCSLEGIRDCLGWQAPGWRRWGAYLLSLVMLAAYTLRVEQVSILLLSALTLTVWALKHDRPVLAGWGMVMAMIKPQITIIALACMALWALRRKPSILLWPAIWLVIIVVLSSMIMPNWWDFPRQDFGRGLFSQRDAAGQYVAGRVRATLWDFASFVLRVSPSVRWVLFAAIGLLGAGLVVFSWHRTRDLELTVAACLVFTLLVAPYAEQYDYVVLTIPLLATLARIPLLGRLHRWLTVSALFFSGSVLLWQRGTYEGYWQLLGISTAFTVALVNQPRTDVANPQTPGAVR